jgi:hypothetical protein
MKVGDSVRHALDEWERGNLEAAMLHACNAVDGTAKKVFPTLGNNRRFSRLLRENYGILGPMGAPGINLNDTRFPVRRPADNLISRMSYTGSIDALTATGTTYRKALR